ncbi:HAD-IA family hydrolase [Streptomyces sp. NBC_01728]|uniref:HAD-IA family hydrolase n=1 Tax=unclassified Streptomyces TaxID=2593676 RepID=UPI002254DCFE|nr:MULTISPECIES: HAD-IA family hydrolase [unclassified Streptomyces]MCX4460007.1 HAD-IA family hydrolase [Streptomyces sp. NBC_01719]MCX4499366.1 HAD-IA family hydrolase [Streptomyces sp. NBC_01728]
MAFSGKIKAAKPASAAFHHCVVAMRAAPTDFLVVDDRGENVRAAQAMGMNRTRLHRSRRAGSRHRHLVADSRTHAEMTHPSPSGPSGWPAARPVGRNNSPPWRPRWRAGTPR